MSTNQLQYVMRLKPQPNGSMMLLIVPQLHCILQQCCEIFIGDVRQNAMWKMGVHFHLVTLSVHPFIQGWCNEVQISGNFRHWNINVNHRPMKHSQMQPSLFLTMTGGGLGQTHSADTAEMWQNTHPPPMPSARY